MKDKTFLIRSKLGEYHAFCHTCRNDFSVPHGGLADIRDHIKSKAHQEHSVITGNQNTLISSPASSTTQVNIQ